jgi:hypothetical protein
MKVELRRLHIPTDSGMDRQAMYAKFGENKFWIAISWKG